MPPSPFRFFLPGLLVWTLVPGRVQGVTAEEQQAQPRVVIAVGGDVLPEPSWGAPQDPGRFLGSMQEEFARADLVFVNLEEPITASSNPTPYKSRAAVRAGRDYILRARDLTIPRHMKEAGVGLVGLANNHMMDYTAAGLRDTLRAFREADLPVVGAGLKPDAERAFVFEKAGIRVALLAFSDVVPRNFGATERRLGIASAKDERDLVEAIRRARRRADFVVLMIHWGGQGKHLITPRQQRLGRLAAEAGCSAVVGMHPHVLQGVEFVGRVPVFHSIGNFAFPSRRPASQESVLVRLSFSPDQLESVEVTPVEISPGGMPRVAQGERGSEILGRLDAFCRMFNSRVEQGRVVPSARRQQLIFDDAASRSGRAKQSRGVEGRGTGRSWAVGLDRVGGRG